MFGMKIWTEKLFQQCASRIDEVFRPNFHSERDQEKNYKLHFLIEQETKNVDQKQSLQYVDKM
jgi:hypothetical protein